MKQTRRSSAAVVLLQIVCALTTLRAEARDVLDVPGLGQIDLDELSDDVRESLGASDQHYEAVVDDPADYPPLEQDSYSEIQQSDQPDDSPPHGEPVEGDEDGRSIDDNIREMLLERAGETGTIDGPAYDEAWQHILSMPTSLPLAPEASIPKETPVPLVERLSQIISPMPALAQSPPPTWIPIGPASFAPGPPFGANRWSGFVGQVAPHPSDPSIAYVGTYGGVWRTLDAGATWLHVTADWATQRSNRIGVHPAVPDSVFAGTGWNFFPSDTFVGDVIADGGRGILRSLDRGAPPSWCRIGPTSHATNDASRHTILNIAFDADRTDPRTYAATDLGLYFSTNAHTAPCSQVTWTLMGGGLPGGVKIRNILVGKWNATPGPGKTLFASTDSSFFRSDNDGVVWTPINSGLPSVRAVYNKAAIAKNPTVTGREELYAIVASTSHATCGAGRTDRVYQALSSGAGTNWQMIGDQTGPSFNCEHGLRSVNVHPQLSDRIVVGADNVYLSVTGASGPYSNLTNGPEGVHPDQNDLSFGPSTTAGMYALYAGNDGGIWRRDNFQASPWTNLNNGLATILFYRGTIDPQNFGVSYGGAQDNGDLRGGHDLLWHQVQGGDGVTNLVDHADSNVSYRVDKKHLDGGMTPVNLRTCDLANPTIQLFNWYTLTMDPTNSNTIAMWVAGRIYRDVVQGACWATISPTTASVKRLTIAPSSSPPSPSSLIFAGTSQGKIIRSSPSLTWSMLPSTNLPQRSITSIAIAPGACAIPTCTLYASVSGFGTDHVFKSTDAGSTWTPIGGLGGQGLPDLPVTDIVVHPTNPSVLWVGTDLGVMQGCAATAGQCDPAGTTWQWANFGTGLPAGTLVSDLDLHAESGILRAFTFGNSAWEVQAYVPARAEQLVSDGTPATGVHQESVSISSSSSGLQYGITLADDRLGANNWHVYFRGFGHGSDGNPSTLSATDFRIDDNSSHRATMSTFGGLPNQDTPPYCGWIAWQDDRLAPYQHIYHNYACSDGYRLFALSDVRVDQHAVSLNATRPAIAFGPYVSPYRYVVAWQADRVGGLHDIYAQFLYGAAQTTGAPKKINTGSGDALDPAIAFGASNHVYIAWRELGAGIRVSKYTTAGTLVAGPVTVAGSASAGDVEIASDNANPENVMLVWVETVNGFERIFRRRLDSALGLAIEQPLMVNSPPLLPPGVVRGVAPSVATAPPPSNEATLVWQANVNSASGSWNAIGHLVGPSGSLLRKDHRVDLAPRGATIKRPRVARSGFGKKFAYAWADNRSGRDKVYTRVP